MLIEQILPGIESHLFSGFSSVVVALQFHELETHIGFPPHKLLGLVGQFCNPATGGQGYLDSACHLGL